MLAATSHKLFDMVCKREEWKYGELGVNDQGRPLVHDIVSKLGCIRVCDDIELPDHLSIPEDVSGLENLALHLVTVHPDDNSSDKVTTSSTTPSNQTDATALGLLTTLDLMQTSGGSSLANDDCRHSVQSLFPETVNNHALYDDSVLMQTEILPATILDPVQEASQHSVDTYNMGYFDNWERVSAQMLSRGFVTIIPGQSILPRYPAQRAA